MGWERNSPCCQAQVEKAKSQTGQDPGGIQMLELYHHLNIFMLIMPLQFQHRLKMYNNLLKENLPFGGSMSCCDMIMAIVLNFGIMILEGFLSLNVASKTGIWHYF